MLSLPADMQKAIEEEDRQAEAKAAAEPKAKKAAKVKELDTPHGMVLYTDGSAQPTNPGYGGWGFHGYIYSHLPPNKGHGCGGQYLLKDGYHEKAAWNAQHKDQKPEEVKPLSYANGFGSFAMHVTNNVAEAMATSNALSYADSQNVKKVLIKTDSKYAVQGTTEWLNIWKRNNWIKGDGQPVANKEIWQVVDANLQKLLDKGVEVDVRWVKGHSVHFGNQKADANADLGAFYSKRGQLRSEIDTRASDGYWNAWHEKHPFICQRRVYFSSIPTTNVAGEYYLGEHGKDDEAAGKRTADGCHSYIKLAKPEDPIELVRNYQCKIAAGSDSIIMARLDKLYEASTCNDILAFGDICFVRPHMGRLDLDFYDEEPLTKEFKPPRIVMRVIQSLSTLKGVFENWQAGDDDGLVSTDVTDLFYEKDDKGENRLKAEYVVGFSSLPITASYGKASEPKQDKIELCLGIDLPDRNALKRLEKANPRVVVVTWMESDKAFRYATILSAGNDHGIWAGMHSNLRVLAT